MTDDEVLNLFRKSGGLLEGHFRLTSGLHSERYLQSALVLQYPEFAETLGRELANRSRHLQPTVVLSPALGGIVIGQEVARGLGVRAQFAERQDGTLTLRRGFLLGPSDRVLVVEDVITTGGSTMETARVAESMGAHVSHAPIAAPAHRDDLLIYLVPLVTWARRAATSAAYSSSVR